MTDRKPYCNDPKCEKRINSRWYVNIDDRIPFHFLCWITGGYRRYLRQWNRVDELRKGQ